MTSEYSDDAIRVLHGLHRDELDFFDYTKTMSKFVWNRVRAREAHREIALLVDTKTGHLNPAGEAMVEQIPLDESHEADQQEQKARDGSLGSTHQKRKIVELLKVGKFALPFDQGRFAAFSITGTNDWQDYASLVLQMIQTDTLLNIEEKLDRLLETVETADDDLEDPPA